MPRSRRLTADEAAERLDLSVGRVTEMARQREIGRKDKGRWTFSEAEIRRVAQERTDRAKALKLRKRLEKGCGNDSGFKQPFLISGLSSPLT
jgi:hypothetical protein